MAFTREQILQTSSRKVVTEVVPTPELGDGESLIVRRLRGTGFYAVVTKSRNDPDNAVVHWIIATVVDESGAQVFSDADVAALSELDGTLLERLSDAAQRLNFYPKADATKNS